MVQSSGKQLGMTLIELMIVILVVGVLASISVNVYSNYVSRTRATAAVAELDPIRSAIGVCHAELGTLTGCNSADGTVPAILITNNITGGASVVDGVIKAETGANDGSGTALTIIDKPTFVLGDAGILWTNTGTVCANHDRGLKPGFGDCPP